MEVPRLLADAGLVAISTAAVFIIFFIRKLFIQNSQLETSVKQLNESVNKLRSDEEAHSKERKVLDTRLEQTIEHLDIQRELTIEVGKSITATEETLQTFVTSNEELQHDVSEKYRQILKCHEQLNYFSPILTKI